MTWIAAGFGHCYSHPGAAQPAGGGLGERSPGTLVLVAWVDGQHVDLPDVPVLVQYGGGEPDGLWPVCGDSDAHCWIGERGADRLFLVLAPVRMEAGEQSLPSACSRDAKTGAHARRDSATIASSSGGA